MFKKTLKLLDTKIKAFADSAPISQDEKTRFQHYVIFMMLGLPTMLVFGVDNLLNGNNLIFVFCLVTAFGLFTGLVILKNIKNSSWVYRIIALLFVGLVIFYGSKK